jgi:hypothetical protein
MILTTYNCPYNFTIQKEHHGKINYLDITIHDKDKQLEFSIYMKPTQIDLIIPNGSYHPYEHELTGKIFIKQMKHNFVFPCQFVFHQLLHNHPHLSSIDDRPDAAAVPSGLSPTPLIIIIIIIIIIIPNNKEIKTNRKSTIKHTTEYQIQL